MSFPEDLLQQAYDLADVSTAYYAVFHLLIDEAVSKWAVERQRGDLARTFGHSKMKGICDDVVKGIKSGADLPQELNTVAHNFIQLQQYRHIADYDNSRQWSRTDVKDALSLAADAFHAWQAIGAQDTAQDFLLQLFPPKLPRQ
jgi:hypothetical protein